MTALEESMPSQPSSAPPSVVLATAGYDHTVRFWEVRLVRGASSRPADA